MLSDIVKQRSKTHADFSMFIRSKSEYVEYFPFYMCNRWKSFHILILCALETEAMSKLPKHGELLGVIGGHHISSDAVAMASFLGEAIVAAGYKLATGGRQGAGESASRGAAIYCNGHGLNVREHVFAIAP